MRMGIRLGGSMVGLLFAAVAAVSLMGASDRERVRPVPLGGLLPDQEGDQAFGVYIPTRFGGVLTVQTSDGTVEGLTGPDGRPRRNGEEVGGNQHGWYTFRVRGAAKTYNVTTRFVQVGQSHRTPWNFYYWPTKADSIHEPWSGANWRVDTMQTFGDDYFAPGVTPGGFISPGQDIVLAGPNGLLETPVGQGDDSTWFPNQYDDLTFRGADGQIYMTPAPMLKYDQIFGTSARSWEAANSQNQDIQRWPGHCLGGAVSSILLNEPVPAPGSGLTRDELKALWAELGENHYNHRIGDYANEIPPGPPRPGWDECDRFVPRVHNMLEQHIRGRKQNLLANLRAFPPRGTPSEVWNHGIGKFVASYHAIPGKGERSVQLDVQLFANSGSCLNGKDDKPRIVYYRYALKYGLDGQVDETDPYASDWIALGGEALYAPLNILEVVETRWAGHNPMVTEANVRSIDMANGGGLGSGRQMTGTPPQFRPVAGAEAGRPRLAFGNGMFGNSGSGATDSPPRRGGLFRLFGR